MAVILSLVLLLIGCGTTRPKLKAIPPCVLPVHQGPWQSVGFLRLKSQMRDGKGRYTVRTVTAELTEYVCANGHHFNIAPPVANAVTIAIEPSVLGIAIPP